MQKQVIPKHKLAAARGKLFKTYGLYMIQILLSFVMTGICFMLLVRSLFPAWTELFFLLSFIGTLGLWLCFFPGTIPYLSKQYQLWKVKKDVRHIVRDAYGYATEENVEAINRVVKTIVSHSNLGKFKNAPKEYYNLISLNPVETAALYGDSYLTIGSLHIRLPLAA